MPVTSLKYLVSTVLLLQLLACSRTPEIDASDVQLTATAPVHDALIYALGMTRGTVIVEAGCVRLASGAQETMTLVFPPHYRAENIGRRVVVTNGSGRRLYTVGKQSDVGGSALPDEPAKRLIPFQARERCPGPYYLVLPYHEGGGTDT